MIFSPEVFFNSLVKFNGNTAAGCTWQQKCHPFIVKLKLSIFGKTRFCVNPVDMVLIGICAK